MVRTPPARPSTRRPQFAAVPLTLPSLRAALLVQGLGRPPGARRGARRGGGGGGALACEYDDDAEIEYDIDDDGEEYEGDELEFDLELDLGDDLGDDFSDDADNV